MWKRISVEVRPRVTPSISRVQGSGTTVTRCSTYRNTRDYHDWHTDMTIKQKAFNMHFKGQRSEKDNIWVDENITATKIKAISLIMGMPDILFPFPSPVTKVMEMCWVEGSPAPGPCWVQVAWTGAGGRCSGGGRLSETAQTPGDSPHCTEG